MSDVTERDYRRIPLGWKPDSPDVRDRMYRDIHPLRAAAIPNKVDTRRFYSSVNFQDFVGSCTAQCATDGLEFPDRKAGRAVVQLSRLQLYWDSRSPKNRDDGASLRDVFLSMNSTGVGRESLWPYAPEKWNVKPSGAVYADASNHKAIEYLRVNQGYDVRAVLAEGFPVCFGMTIYDSFYDADHDGNVPIPSPDETDQGGHAMLIVGYKNAERVYIVRNSWGASWGDQGYCYIPYDIIDNPGYARDFWVVKKVGQGPPNPQPRTCCGITLSAGRKLSGVWQSLGS